MPKLIDEFIVHHNQNRTAEDRELDPAKQIDRRWAAERLKAQHLQEWREQVAASSDSQLVSPSHDTAETDAVNASTGPPPPQPSPLKRNLPRPQDDQPPAKRAQLVNQNTASRGNTLGNEEDEMPFDHGDEEDDVEDDQELDDKQQAFGEALEDILFSGGDDYPDDERAMDPRLVELSRAVQENSQISALMSLILLWTVFGTFAGHCTFARH